MIIQKHQSRFIEMFGNAENTKPLSECIGTTFPGEWGEDDSDGTGVNVIRTTNFTNSGKLDLTNVVTRKIGLAKIDKKHLIPGDIILERSGGTADNPVGRVVYFEATGTFLFNNLTQLLRCKNGVNSLFVFYSLYNYYHTHKSEIRSMGNKTTGIQNLKMNKYWDIPIVDAPSEQQEQFVCLYKQADKSKFTDFKSRFIEMFGNSNANPKGLPRKQVSELFTLQMGKTPARDTARFWSKDDTGHKWISIADMSNYCYYTADTEERITDDAVKGARMKLIPSNSVIMSFKLTIGRVAVTSEPIFSNEAIVAFLQNGNVYSTRFLYYLVMFHDWLDNAALAVKGKTLNKESIGKNLLIIPPRESQNAFAAFAEQADKSKYLS